VQGGVLRKLPDPLERLVDQNLNVDPWIGVGHGTSLPKDVA
jgi:hypothetical protein